MTPTSNLCVRRRMLTNSHEILSLCYSTIDNKVCTLYSTLSWLDAASVEQPNLSSLRNRFIAFLVKHLLQQKGKL